MLKITIICLIFSVLTATTVRSQITEPPNDAKIQEALKFSGVIISVIEEYIHESLPPTANVEGEKILENVKDGLKNCESFVHTSLDIWLYKVCSSSLLRDGMAALGALQAKYRPYRSGASKVGFFV